MRIETKFFLETFNEVINNHAYQALIWMVIIDLVTGVAKGVRLKRVDSRMSTDGMLRHVIVIMVVTLTSVYGRILGFTPLATGIGYWYIGSYGISILENCSALGVKFPPVATQYFNRMQDNYSKELDKAAGQADTPRTEEKHGSN